jgi:hypothetical protein
MDTIKMLLAATTALLFGAFAWNWYNQRGEIKNAPTNELARIRLQLEEIKREELNLNAEKRLREMGVGSSTPNNLSQPSQGSIAEKEAKLREIEERNKALQDELDMKLKESEVKKQEDVLLEVKVLEKTDKELRRARQIKEALLMAKVSEFVNNPNTGSFVTIQLVMPEHVQVDTVLAVRRKDGIAGNIKVREIIGKEGVADVLPGIGPFSPEAGDELIVPPAF